MSEDNKDLIPLGEGTLPAIIEKRTQIANRVLGQLSANQTEAFFWKYPDFFRLVVSRYYPLDIELFSYFAGYLDCLDWGELARNTALPWNEDFIECNLDPSILGLLIWNKSLPWDENLIERFKDNWDWDKLSKNKLLPWSSELIERFKDRWNWWWLSGNETLPWSIELIERYKYFWDWKSLSGNETLPWSIELIERYEDFWDWKGLSRIRALPWNTKFLEDYADRWNWEVLGGNRSLPWSMELIEKYYYKDWDWRYLSGNTFLPWSEDLVKRFENEWVWGILSQNIRLPWSIAFIDRYKKHWDWEYLSQNEALPWSLELIERYAKFWDWECLSWNRALPWSNALIERYAEFWVWGRLSLNSSLPWSNDLIDRYAEFWDWEELTDNPALPWSYELFERFSEKWDYARVAEIYDGNVRALSRQQVVHLLEMLRQSQSIDTKKAILVNQDNQYRQARDIYNRITDYGLESRFNNKTIPRQDVQIDLFEKNRLLYLKPFFAMLQQLADVFTVFKQLANQGYGKAYFPLAAMYANGQGISQNIEEADHYSRLAFSWCFANQALDDLEIWMDLGCMYFNACGVTQDEDRAVFWWRKAAEQDYAEAQYFLAMMYEIGVIEDPHSEEQAVFWARKAAEQGYAGAQFYLAKILDGGQLINKDTQQAEFWYRAAANQGDAAAQCCLGMIFAREHRDDEQATFWLRKAAEQGYAFAQFCLGCQYEIGSGVTQDDQEAVFWYREAAEQGDTDAQYSLGLIYEKRWFDEYKDEDAEQALFWFRKAAEQGDHEAEYNIYEHLLLKSDEEQVLFFYREAAAHGHAEAQFALGFIYENKGACLEEGNNEQAVFWWRKAAEQGHKDAQACLGRSYYDGYGVEQDKDQAVFWWRRAAEQGHKEAQTCLSWMYATIISNEDILEPVDPVLLRERLGITDSQEEVIDELQLSHLGKVKEMHHFLNQFVSSRINHSYVIVTSFGNGLRIEENELMNNHINDELHKMLPIGASILDVLLIHNQTDLLAIATLQGRLLVFSVNELVQGMDNKLIQIPIADLLTGKNCVVAAVILTANSHLKIIAGKRHITLKFSDIEQYSGSRAERGLHLPRGFQRVDRLECG